MHSIAVTSMSIDVSLPPHLSYMPYISPAITLIPSYHSYSERIPILSVAV